MNIGEKSMVKKLQLPSDVRQEQLGKLVESRRQQESTDNNVVCEANINYLDSRSARVSFWIAGDCRTALYELNDSGWRCYQDWRD
ncbi:hypothetical protein [Aeromonas dhakensis]|uniref:hypothetical protein n=1 Tax=Aeromonas dhakensis TaxID=196024 RepID=UPI0038D191C6